jgi:site-specific DNA-methyltransferase (adenine-specific)
MKELKLLNGDNIELLKTLPENSIDSVVTDPPYGLSFMNKKWDHQVPSVEFWKEVYRVLKPGGHVLSFGGTRTYHRMTVNIEDAGFEIRDQIMWLYGSGFPKSHNIGKSVDKIQGNEREVDEEKTELYKRDSDYVFSGDDETRKEYKITKGTSEWEGWGTALKPANEPICVARKPLSEKTIADNVLKWGTGGINIDGCRVGSDNNEHHRPVIKKSGHFNNGNEKEWTPTNSEEGRFPANIIFECICDEVIKGEKGEVMKSGGSRDNCDLSHEWGYSEIKRTTFTDKGDIHTNPMCPCRLLDEQSGISKSSCKSGVVEGKEGSVLYHNHHDDKKKGAHKQKMMVGDYSDKGGASRFFYQAKVGKKERNMGLDESIKSNHPTMKPVALMAYLCRLVTPPNGICLDPFMGSGSTGIAARLEGFRFIGMEMDEEYFKIASTRIENFESYREFVQPDKKLKNGKRRCI